ncbi:MAG: alpha-hydroxy acid oxidase [Pseudolabrys sp.]
MGLIDRAVNIEDLRHLALRRLPRFVGDYLETGAGDGGGIRRNVDAFRKYRLVPRVLTGPTPVDTAVDLFGTKYASLFGISAVGIAGIYRRRADECLAEAARAANIPFILSGASHASIETICRIAPDHTWYQLYGAHRPDVTETMMAQARDAGVKVLVYTVDYPVAPRSDVIARTGVSMATGPSLRTFPRLFLDALLHPFWTADYLRGGGLPKLESWARHAPRGGNAREVAAYYVANWSNAQTWRDLDRVREFWKGPLIVKGIVHSDDVLRAVQAGADAVTISNHGGNKLDCMQGALDSLAGIRPAVGGQVRLFFDGGIRRGSDLIVAKALGADFCFTGRATLYGVTAGGLRGARRAVDLLQSELEYTMAMVGCRTVPDITKDHVCLEPTTP